MAPLPLLSSQESPLRVCEDHCQDSIPPDCDLAANDHERVDVLADADDRHNAHANLMPTVFLVPDNRYHEFYSSPIPILDSIPCDCVVHNEPRTAPTPACTPANAVNRPFRGCVHKWNIINLYDNPSGKLLATVVFQRLGATTSTLECLIVVRCPTLDPGTSQAFLMSDFLTV